MKKIAIMSSGSGEIFEAIVNYFKSEKTAMKVEITCISDILEAEILECAKKMGIRYKYLPVEENSEYFKTHDFDLIVLCDYIGKLTANVIELGRFVNLHYSLLPSFKEDDAAAKAFSAGIKVSGVTVHWVTKDVDSVKIIAQYPVLIGNLMHFDEFKTALINLSEVLYPIVIEKILGDKVFDFSDLFGGCSGGCSGGCGGCH